MDREALGSVLVEDVEELIKNKNFDRATDSIKGNNMGLIKPKDCCRLFMMASEHPNKVLTKNR
jgi:hypothetical protein